MIFGGGTLVNKGRRHWKDDLIGITLRDRRSRRRTKHLETLPNALRFGSARLGSVSYTHQRASSISVSALFSSFFFSSDAALSTSL